MNNVIIPAFFAFFALMSSCRPKPVTDVKVPKVDAQLVLFCFLSPDDSVIEVQVTKSVPVFGTTLSNEDLTVANAEVKISNGTQSMLVPFDTGKRKYRLSQSLFPLLPSSTYTISAQANGMAVKGSTNIPVNIINPTGIKAQLIPGSTTGETDVLFNILWKDEAAVKNYYRLHLETIGYFAMSDTFTNIIADEMFVDDNKDGATLSGQYQSPQYKFGSSNTADYFVYLLNTDVHYYQYHVRRLAYSGDDPFSEPFQQYSNVNGGLGVVSSFRKSVVKVTL